MKRAWLLVLALLAGSVPATGRAHETCDPRTLVLSAFPGEIAPLLAAADVDHVEQVDGRAFFVGMLEGHEVVLALTGIGLSNAEETTRLAIEHFRCEAAPTIRAIVFSGVSGGPVIGDVMIPDDWTLDGEQHFAADPAMMAVAADVASGDTVTLARATPAGDPACVGIDPDLVTTVEVAQAPQIRVGGHGASADGFDGRTLPCVPGGGDVFGCWPCAAPGQPAPDPERFATHAAPFLDPAFFFEYFANSAPPPGSYIAVDMETAAVARVADEHAIPFLAFRAASDGDGDPLHLPGFPFQFFFYRQLAADNAAAVARAFLAAWPGLA